MILKHFYNNLYILFIKNEYTIKKQPIYLKLYNLLMHLFIELIKQNNYINIYSHIVPDYDSLSSMIALKLLIELNFDDKEVNLISNDQFNLKQIDSNLFIKEDKTNSKEKVLSIIVDVADKRRISSFKDVNNPIIIIDHHKISEHPIEGNIQLSLIDKEQLSTTTMLFDLINELDLKHNKEIIYYLGLGLISDTDCNLEAITNNKYSNRLFNELNNLSICIEELKSVCDWKPEGYKNIVNFINKEKIILDNIVYALIPSNEYTKEGLLFHHLNKDGIKEIINDAELSILFTEIPIKPNYYYMELRTLNPNIRVDLIANKYKGGGHNNRAAAILEFKDIDNLLLDLKNNH